MTKEELEDEVEGLECKVDELEEMVDELEDEVESCNWLKVHPRINHLTGIDAEKLNDMIRSYCADNHIPTEEIV